MLAFLKDIAIVEIDDSVARQFGEIRAALFDAGLPTPDMDLMNAATALVHGFTMVTHNTKDYADVPGLSLADWLNPDGGGSQMAGGQTWFLVFSHRLETKNQV